MTTQKKAIPVQDTPPSPPETEEGQDPAPDQDPFLERLVIAANAKALGETISVTLNVGGMIVSGRLAAISDYYANFGDELEGGLNFDPEISEELRGDVIEALVGPYRNAAKETYEHWVDNPGLKDRPYHIHLRDALLIMPGQPSLPTNRRVWWRGRIGQVDGFMLGQLDPQDRND